MYIIDKVKRVVKKAKHYVFNNDERSAKKAFKNKKWIDAAEKYTAVAQKKGDSASLDIYKYLNESLRMINDKDKEIFFWKRTYSSNIITGEKVREYLLEGNIIESFKYFEKLVNGVFDNNKTKDLWLDSYKKICAVFDSDIYDLSYVLENIFNNSINIKDSKKIIVSGMGWSGSGALYDFFKEFSNIESFDMEFTHIEASPGLNTLFKKSKNKEEFKIELLDFFMQTLLGYYPYNDYIGCKPAKRARTFSVSKNNLKYASGINIFCNNLYNYYIEDKLNSVNFQKLADIVLETILFTKNKNNNPYYLFNNIIHIYNIDAAEIINDALIFCAFRDPRSNYVARVNEDSLYQDDVETFIANYRNERGKFIFTFNNLKNKKSVKAIQFEEFVLSEAFRNNLASETGLSFKDQATHKHFKPWKSVKMFIILKLLKTRKQLSRLRMSLKNIAVIYNSILCLTIADLNCDFNKI